MSLFFFFFFFLLHWPLLIFPSPPAPTQCSSYVWRCSKSSRAPRPPSPPRRASHVGELRAGGALRRRHDYRPVWDFPGVELRGMSWNRYARPEPDTRPGEARVRALARRSHPDIAVRRLPQKLTPRLQGGRSEPATPPGTLGRPCFLSQLWKGTRGPKPW